MICKYLALYFDLWSKLYYIYLNFHSSENITLQSKISLRKQYNLPLGKYSCGVAINPYRYATNSWCFIFLVSPTRYCRFPKGSPSADCHLWWTTELYEFVYSCRITPKQNSTCFCKCHFVLVKLPV